MQMRNIIIKYLFMMYVEMITYPYLNKNNLIQMQ